MSMAELKNARRVSAICFSANQLVSGTGKGSAVCTLTHAMMAYGID